VQVICSGQKRYIHLKFFRKGPDYGWDLMRLLANENIPLDAVETLRVGGHDVLRIREEVPGFRVLIEPPE